MQISNNVFINLHTYTFSKIIIINLISIILFYLNISGCSFFLVACIVSVYNLKITYIKVNILI